MKEYTYTIRIKTYTPDMVPTPYKELIDVAKKQTQSAWVPYSGFHVGAAVLLEDGTVVEGSNQENAAYPSGTCAERTALFYANSKYPDTPVEAVAVAAFTKNTFTKEPITPCGSCRQVLLETENRFKKEIKIVLYGTDAVYILDSVRQLLPLSFGQERLLST